MNTMLKQIALAACISWFSSTLLGLLFAICMEACFSLDTLQLPGVIPIAVITSSEIALGMTPLVFWCLRIKDPNWLYYGVGLLILLSVYIVYVTPVHAGFGFYGSIILAAVGLTVIKIMHPPS